MATQEWSATLRVSFDDEMTPKEYAEATSVLSGAVADCLGTIEEKAPNLDIGLTMGLSNGRSSAEPRAPAGTNGGKSGNGRRTRGPNKPKMQVPAHPLAHGAMPVETDE